MPLPVPPEDGKHCQKCDKPDTADNMVGCDSCETWEHYGCAGVSDSIADSNRSWKCGNCRSASVVEEKEKSSSTISAYTSASSKASRRVQLQLELLDQQNKLKMKRLDEEEKYLKQKFEILMQLEEEGDLASNRSSVSEKSKQQRLEKWLEDEVMVKDVYNTGSRLPSVPHSSGVPATKQGKVVITPAFETQSVSGKLDESSVSSEPKIVSTPTQLKNPTAVSIVGQGLSRIVPPGVVLAPKTFHSNVTPQTDGHNQLYDYVPPAQASCYVPRTPANTFPWAASMRTTTNPTFSSSAGLPTVTTEVSATQGSSMHKNFPMTTMGYGNGHLHQSTAPVSFRSEAILPGFGYTGLPSATISNNRADPVSTGMNPYGPRNNQHVSVLPGPNASQLAARQVMPRDLPTFSGAPEEWPIFCSSFKNSTEVCGYNDAENLARLQRSLRGNALEAVRSRLLLPSSVPNVMETLRMLYGRPEILINALLKRVRAAPAPKPDNLKSIVDYGLAVQNLVDHMIIAEQQNHLSNPMLLNELVEKLPTHLKLQWGSFKQYQTDVNLATFNRFMSNLVGLASDLMINTESLQSNAKESKSEKHKEKLFVHNQEPPAEQNDERDPEVSQNRLPKGCTYCEDVNHQISACQSFKGLIIDARWKAVRQKNLCRTCLVPHRKWPCRSKKECGFEGCRARHHQLLHAQYAQQTDQVLSEASSSNDSLQAHQNHHRGKSYSLFRYLPVKLFGNGKVINIFAFLDEGSSLTLLEADVAEQLGIKGPSNSLWLSWTGNISREEKGSKCISLAIAGGSSNKKYTIENVQTVDELNLPKQSFNYEDLADQYPHLTGLPLNSYLDIVPRMIIGLEHVRLLTALKTREGRNEGPVAVKTRLGWCAFGKNCGSAHAERLNFHFGQTMSNQSLHNMMKNYFAVEESAVTKQPEGDEDKRALQILEQTTVRKDDHYETGLLWKVDDPVFPDSLPMAKGRLKSLEKRLSRDPELAAKVNEQIESYVKKGYAHKATKEELEQTDPRRVWYLPLGVIVNPRKPEKIRLIWDAAAKVEGISFNDLLLKGPDLLASLVAVILRFRERNIAVCGDICEMFHQIWIRVTDTKFQRFLWRSSPDAIVEIYVMDVATFGATCSPCSAQFIKNKNAEQYAATHPRAVEAITKNHYVDDFLDSVDTVEEAVQLVNDVKTIHAAAGFDIRKFRSNASEVLAAVGEPEASSDKPISSDKQAISERVLGLIWDPVKDVFTFDTSCLLNQKLFNGNMIPTKRQVLQMVMKLFDPLGFISHYTIHGKILMQEIWRSGTNWDEAISENLLDMWYRWSELLALVGEVQVPRCYFGNFPSETLRELQVHVFVDASESAYACVAYLRLDCAEGTKCAMVASKTKVAPLKPLSIPRLELQAAMIGARLLQTVCSSLTLPISKRFLWSDSTTVLAWLRSDSRRYHQFVGFRVGEILSLSSLDEWRYVPSGLNVADEATKWASGPSFQPESRWFSGPDFLTKECYEWPVEAANPVSTNEELRPVLLHRHHVMEKLINETRFSNWNRLVRAMAYVHRAVAVLKKKIPVQERGSVLQSSEIQEAEYTVLRQVQAEAYPDELRILENRGTIPKSSSLYQLTPFLDDRGIIRMGSRIGAAPESSFSAKYPVILPKKHHVTTLLIDNFHRRFLHANNETVHNEMRQQYYISGLRALIRKVSRECQRCKVKTAVPKPPMMAPLPSIRLTPFIRAFTYVGVDYFGPLEVKVGRSLVKRWIALFTCLTVRAVHLKVTHSLSSQSCIMAFRRFVARRGAPLEVYSDNGTNFVGAKRQLSEEQQKIRDISQDCASTFTNANTTWHFNVPAAPHMGGPWERLVRSVKTAMKAISDSPRYPNDEVLETILLEAEGVVNSRPLTYVPLEHADDEALTPNHFLLYGSSGVKQPSTAEVNSGTILRDSWKITQQIVDGFWRRWVREYLPMLSRRTKWFEKVKPLEPGDLVIIVDENVRNSWTRGRILETTKGADNQVRRATVQTARGIVSRPAVKLALLDVRMERVLGTEEGRSGTGEAHGSEDVAEPTVHSS